MSFPTSQLKVINDLKPSKPSRYYRLNNDGSYCDMYGEREIELNASGAEITRILSVLESDLDMEWRFSHLTTFPTLKPRGKYTLRINDDFRYSVCRNYLYEVDGRFEGGV